MQLASRYDRNLVLAIPHSFDKIYRNSATVRRFSNGHGSKHPELEIIGAGAGSISVPGKMSSS
jgi:hypothetical protein